jgi:class 3 adenylate cyclase
MDSNHKIYDYKASAARIAGYLAQPDEQYEVRDILPSADTLTFKNGFYAYCSAIFIDLRDSSSLPDHYNRHGLARMYRAYVSEMVAILNGESYTRAVNIAGDCVWAVVNTPRTSDIDDTFTLACQANTLMRLLNQEMVKNNYDTPIKAGIGVSYGRTLMVKAGYDGSGINDVVYMGDVVNEAAHLAAKGNQGWAGDPIMVAETFHNNLNDHNKSLLKWNNANRCYSGYAVVTGMDQWISDQT